MSPEFEKETILVVDDNTNNLKLLHDTLQKAGYRVLVAQSGTAAIERVKEMVPSLILMDIMMPGMSGIDACKTIRSELKQNEEIPIIFVTALHDMESKSAAYEAGGVDFISKPFNANEVLLRVKTHLEIVRLRCALNREIQAKTIVIKELEEFSHIVAHDLKNPLANIEGLVDTLVDMGNDLTIEERDEVFVMLQQSSQKMRRLIDSFLLLSDLESEENELEMLDLEDIVKRSISWHTRDIRKKQVHLEMENLSYSVRGEKTWLEMAVRHYVCNALEYGGRNWQIFAERENATITLHFTDDGVGVPPRQVPYLFRNSSELASLKRYGVGMGTTVVHMVTERIGAKSGYSRKENYSDFWITFESN